MNMLKKSLILLILFTLALFQFNCQRKKSFKDLIFHVTESILFKKLALFQSTLISKYDFLSIKETRFNGNYKTYLKINTNFFKRAKKINNKKFRIFKIEKGNPITEYGIKLYKNTKIFLKDNNNEKYHYRISYIIKLNSQGYKIFLLNIF